MDRNKHGPRHFTNVSGQRVGGATRSLTHPPLPRPPALPPHNPLPCFAHPLPPAQPRSVPSPGVCGLPRLFSPTSTDGRHAKHYRQVRLSGRAGGGGQLYGLPAAGTDARMVWSSCCPFIQPINPCDHLICPLRPAEQVAPRLVHVCVRWGVLCALARARVCVLVRWSCSLALGCWSQCTVRAS
jgi:hypothetical protein